MNRPLIIPFVLASALLTLSLLASAAFAQNAPCGPHDAVAKALLDVYGEVPTARAIVANGPRVLEVFSNPETGTWTVLITDPTGVSCSPSSGNAWQIVPPGDPA